MKENVPVHSASSFATLAAFFLVFTAVIPGAPVFGQHEKVVSIGMVGAEINMNSGSAFGVGAVVALDFNFGDRWAAGLTAKSSHDLSSAWVMEGGVLIRRYFNGDPTWQVEKHSGFFMQAEGGAHFIAEDNVFMYKGDTLLRPMGGFRIGYRFLLGTNRVVYIEPFFRGGYPFAWGAGLMAGVRF